MSRALPIALVATTLISLVGAFSGCASKQLAALDAAQDPSADSIMRKFEAHPLDEAPKVSSSPTPTPTPVNLFERAKGEDAAKSTAPVPETPLVTKPSTADAAVTGKRGRKPKKKKGEAAVVVADAAPVAAPSPQSLIPDRRPKLIPFWVGELQVLDITYLGMIAGQFELELKPEVVINDRKAYHFEGRARTSSLFNIVYSLNDRIESFVDEVGLFSHKFHMVLDQTKQKRDSLELYDYEKKQVYYWNRKNHVTKGYSEIKEYKPIEPFSQDSYSAYEYMRTLPLETGKEYSIPVVSEGSSWEGVVTVVRREEIETYVGRFKSIVVKLQTRFAGVLKQGQGDSFLWLSDDGRRFILQMEAKVKIGSVMGVIKKLELGQKPTAEVSANASANAVGH